MNVAQVSGSEVRRSLRQRWWAWAVIGLVMIGAIALGGSRITPTTGSSQDRLFGLAEQMKCLACSGESVANSQADLAIQMRQEIQRQMSAGKTDDEILSYFADRYGARVLLNPSSSGLSSLVWVIPVVVTAAAIVGLGLAFARWRGAGAVTPPSDEDRELVERARREASS